MAAKKKTSKALSVDWRKELAAKASKMSAKGRIKAAGGEYISTKGGKFSIGDRIIGDSFPAVVIGAVYENSWFDSKFVEGEPSCPACFAIAYDEEDLAPHPDSPVPQAETCEECEKNQWGSSEEGRGKACGNRFRLAVVHGDDTKANASEIEVKGLRLAPTSINNFRSYVAELEARGDLELVQAACNIYFDPESKQAVPPILFEFMNEITSDKALNALVSKWPDAEKLLEQPYDKANYKPPGRARGKKKTTKKKTSKKRASKFS